MHSIMTLRITTFSITTNKIVIFSIMTLSIRMLSIMALSIMIFNVMTNKTQYCGKKYLCLNKDDSQRSISIYFRY